MVMMPNNILNPDTAVKNVGSESAQSLATLRHIRASAVSMTSANEEAMTIGTTIPSTAAICLTANAAAVRNATMAIVYMTYLLASCRYRQALHLFSLIALRLYNSTHKLTLFFCTSTKPLEMLMLWSPSASR